MNSKASSNPSSRQATLAYGIVHKRRHKTFFGAGQLYTFSVVGNSQTWFTVLHLSGNNTTTSSCIPQESAKGRVTCEIWDLQMVLDVVVLWGKGVGNFIYGMVKASGGEG